MGADPFRDRGEPLKERFHRRYEVLPSGCWSWLPAPDALGYGRIRDEGKNVYAHRVSYELHKGPIPDGLQIDHLCRVRRCVNPDHLEAVTGEENRRRGHEALGLKQYATHCPNGHEWAETARVTSEGWRRCVECDRDAECKRGPRRDHRNPALPREACSECGEPCCLTNHGLIKGHGPFANRCAGSYRPPAPTRGGRDAD